jgi:hypothetical protein
MAQQFCQGCGASLMPTLRMCPTCGSKNLDANPPQAAPQVTPSFNQPASSSAGATTSGSQLKGLGGWLILIGFGLIIGPIRLINLLNTNYKPYFNTDLLEPITNPSSSSYIPNFIYLFYAEFITILFIILLSLYLLYLFFAKKKTFPKNYIFISLFVILYIPVDAFIASTIMPNEKVVDGEMVKSFFQTLISGAIWIPYMMKSERVKNTFIED